MAAEQAAWDYVKDKAKSIAGQLLASSLQSILPGGQDFSRLSGLTKSGQGILFDDLVTDATCSFLGSNGLRNRLWLEVPIDTSGNPQGDGYGCPARGTPQGTRLNWGRLTPPHPDFVYKVGGPLSTDKSPKAYLIGDVKLNLGTLRRKIGSNQWNAIVEYAAIGNNHEYAPLAVFIFLYKGQNFQNNRNALERAAAAKGVAALLIFLWG